MRPIDGQRASSSPKPHGNGMFFCSTVQREASAVLEGGRVGELVNGFQREGATVATGQTRAAARVVDFTEQRWRTELAPPTYMPETGCCT
jgi:hypothetical protein